MLLSRVLCTRLSSIIKFSHRFLLTKFFPPSHKRLNGAIPKPRYQGVSIILDSYPLIHYSSIVGE